MSFRVLGTALLVGAGLFVALPQADAATTAAAAAPVTSAVVNNPVGTDAEKRAIQDKIVELIDGAAAGSRIRMAMFYGDDPTVPNALVSAKNRGVNVQIVFNDNDQTVAPYSTLVAALGTNTSAASFVTFCPVNRGCIGTRTINDVKAINHNKFFLFTSTNGASNVVVQSTANLHDGRDGLRGWNAAMIIVNNTSLFSSYDGYFTDLSKKTANNNYYDTRVPVQAGTEKVFFYPRAESNGDPYNDPGEDTIMTMLNNTACSGNTSVGTQDGTFRTIIRVNMMSMSRSYISQKLWDMDNAGCYVEVVARYDPASAAEVTAMKNLLKKTTSSYGGPVVKYYCVGDSVWTHAKYFQIEGNYYDKGDRRLTFVGSHNWSYNSLRQSDEVMLQSENSSIFETIRTGFRTARDAAGIRSAANGGTATC
jgi:phosphatidylserine/phosphatidylglycerophosphate/cardiolipin synthase-like enzyme